MRRGRSAGGIVAAAASLALVTPVAACAAANQNVLHPESKPEHAISTLRWVMLIACPIGFGVIVILLFLGWLRRNRESLPFGGGDRAGMAIVVGLGVFVPIMILSLLFVLSDIYVLQTTEAPAATSTKLSVQVIGHDWFWEVRYPGTKAVTANDIHSVGSDLTHLASRTTLAALTVPNDSSDLAGWIQDPQHLRHPV